MRVLALVGMLFASVGFAETADILQFRELLAGGYYHSAAHLNGPDLVRAHPENPEVYYLYGRALFLSGDFPEAHVQLETAVAMADEPPAEYYLLQAEILGAEGRLTESLSAAREAFHVNTTYNVAMTLGTIAWQLAEFDIALEAFEAASNTPDGRRELWPHLAAGRVQLARGEYDLALAAFTRAIDVFEESDTGSSGLPSPGYVEAFYRLGQTYERLGDFAQAELHYRAARSSDPNYAPAIDGLDRLSRRFE